MQGSALAQGPAQEASGVPARALRIPLKQIRLGVGAQRSESKQVGSLDLRQRPIRILGHTAILSRRVPIHPMTRDRYAAIEDGYRKRGEVQISGSADRPFPPEPGLLSLQTPPLRSFQPFGD